MKHFIIVCISSHVSFVSVNQHRRGAVSLRGADHRGAGHSSRDQSS